MLVVLRGKHHFYPPPRPRPAALPPRLLLPPLLPPSLLFSSRVSSPVVPARLVVVVLRICFFLTVTVLTAVEALYPAGVNFRMHVKSRPIADFPCGKERGTRVNKFEVFLLTSCSPK